VKTLHAVCFNRARNIYDLCVGIRLCIPIRIAKNNSSSIIGLQYSRYINIPNYKQRVKVFRVYSTHAAPQYMQSVALWKMYQ